MNERLEEIKKWNEFDGGIHQHQIDWLIQQAEILEQNKDVVKSIVGEEALHQNGEYESEMMRLQNRVEELETKNNHAMTIANKRLARILMLQNSVEELEKEIGNYKKACSALEVVESYSRKETQRYKQVLETASSEMGHALYSHKSDDVKRFYIENAKRQVDEALAGENNET